jgi:hypothetical protein
LSAEGVRQILLKRAAAAGLKGTLAEPVSPQGWRAGFVTTACRNGVPDEEPAPEPDDHAQLRPTRQAQPGQPGRETRFVARTVLALMNAHTWTCGNDY